MSDEDPDYYETLQNFRLSMIFYEAEKGTQFITGHFWLNENLISLKPLGYTILTCLRDPVDRWFSHYLYARHKEGSHGRIETDIDDFLTTQTASSFGTTYVRYLGGIREDRGYSSPAAVRKAIGNLEIFDLMGFLHDLDGFRKRLECKTGLKLSKQHRRKSPANPALGKKIKDSPDIRREVERLCEPDNLVYEQAVLKFT